ncbi:hypothetical protein TNCV_4029411 [Trichonephila clavipes]|nr:hypothetical protein TNCV_4029411 [Trichonephila clavipes]
MGNPDLNGDNIHTGIGIFCTKSRTVLATWRSFSSLMFICVHDEVSAVEQSLVQVFKGEAGNLLWLRCVYNRCAACPLLSAFSYADTYQRARRACNVSSYFRPVSVGKMKLHSESQQKSHVNIHHHLMFRFT